jgi:hypothetical protein
MASITAVLGPIARAVLVVTVAAGRARSGTAAAAVVFTAGISTATAGTPTSTGIPSTKLESSIALVQSIRDVYPSLILKLQVPFMGWFDINGAGAQGEFLALVLLILPNLDLASDLVCRHETTFQAASGRERHPIASSRS